MKKKLSLLLALVLCLGLIPKAYASSPHFADVPTSHWAYDAIMEAYADGAVDGTGNNSSGQPLYSPDDKVTMAQFITILTRAFYADEVAAIPSTAGGVWYDKYYAVASNNVLFQHVADISGDAEVTRETMAQVMYSVMINKALVHPDQPTQQELQLAKSRIPDFKSVSDDNAEAVATCYHLELITGMDQFGSFAPKGVMNRAQTAVIYTRLKAVMNLLGGIEVQKPSTNPGTTTTPTETPSQTNGATLTNGMPVTVENVLALLEEYKNGKAPGAKAQASGFTSYTDMSHYDAYNPKYQMYLPGEGLVNGIECAKFAYAFFEDIFGTGVTIREYHNPADVRPGDIIHFDGHWCIATGLPTYNSGYSLYKAPNVGGGSAGEIGWGNGEYMRDDNVVAFYTCYPE